MAKEEDGTDIAAFLSGDREGLDRLVLRHKDRIFNLCYRLLGEYSDAEECAQETFIKVFRIDQRLQVRVEFFELGLHHCC